jgi:hypothetical protein
MSTMGPRIRLRGVFVPSCFSTSFSIVAQKKSSDAIATIHAWALL